MQNYTSESHALHSPRHKIQSQTFPRHIIGNNFSVLSPLRNLLSNLQIPLHNLRVWKKKRAIALWLICSSIALLYTAHDAAQGIVCMRVIDKYYSNHLALLYYICTLRFILYLLVSAFGVSKGNFHKKRPLCRVRARACHHHHVNHAAREVVRGVRTRSNCAAPKKTEIPQIDDFLQMYVCVLFFSLSFIVHTTFFLFLFRSLTFVLSYLCAFSFNRLIHIHITIRLHYHRRDIQLYYRALVDAWVTYG